MAIKNIIAGGIGFSPGSISFIPTLGFSIGIAAFAAQMLKSLTLNLGSGIGTTLGLKGNVLPLTTSTVIPTVEPPGGHGLVLYIIGGVLTIYVWDPITTTWVT